MIKYIVEEYFVASFLHKLDQFVYSVDSAFLDKIYTLGFLY